MGETLGMIHIGAKVLYISGSVKLENKVSIPKIQQWERHSTSVTDIPITKKGKGKMKEEKGHQSQLISKASRTNSIRFQDLGLVLCGWRVLLLHLWFCLLCPRIDQLMNLHCTIAVTSSLSLNVLHMQQVRLGETNSWN